MKVVLSIVCVFALVGCSSIAELGGGMYAKTIASQDRDPFGTNSGHAKLDICRGEKGHWWQSVQLYDCRTEVEWQLISSQGQGGIIVAGMATGVGIGVAGALMSNMTQAVNASQTVTVSTMRAHHR